MSDTEVRPVRSCDVCGQVDDHPRHILQTLDGGTVTIRHMDCCAANGCEVCQATEEANGALRGQELIDHLAAERAAAEEA